LDGVLTDSCDLHYITLNKAIEQIAGSIYQITREEHIHQYNGFNTVTKLKLLSEKKNLPWDLHASINALKQELTLHEFQTYKEDHDKIELLTRLQTLGYKLCCASNCKKASLHLILQKLGFLKFFSHILSNEDVEFPKPDGDIYLKCILLEKMSPQETIIIEDSFIGLMAAKKSGAYISHVRNSKEVTLSRILHDIHYYQDSFNGIVRKTMFRQMINVVIPMAGNGSRFASVGYKHPKPLIDVFGRPMISWVIQNIGIDAHYIFICKKDHYDHYHLDSLLHSLVPKCTIIQLDKTTEGAACTVLTAKDIIDNDHPLIIANSDQWLDWNSEEFIFNFLIKETYSSVKVSTFLSDGSQKWSYVHINDQHFVDFVKEKDPISIYGTTGIYMWRKGSDFVRSANKMILSNKRTNNEFYVAPVINEIIEEGALVTKEECKRFWSLGVPDDLHYFLTHYTTP
jgi:HAD superfamily hydrolase (TIGR01509 family)